METEYLARIDKELAEIEAFFQRVHPDLATIVPPSLLPYLHCAPSAPDSLDNRHHHHSNFTSSFETCSCSSSSSLSGTCDLHETEDRNADRDIEGEVTTLKALRTRYTQLKGIQDQLFLDLTRHRILPPPPPTPLAPATLATERALAQEAVTTPLSSEGKGKGKDNSQSINNKPYGGEEESEKDDSEEEEEEEDGLEHDVTVLVETPYRELGFWDAIHLWWTQRPTPMEPRCEVLAGSDSDGKGGSGKGRIRSVSAKIVARPPPPAAGQPCGTKVPPNQQHSQASEHLAPGSSSASITVAFSPVMFKKKGGRRSFLCQPVGDKQNSSGSNSQDLKTKDKGKRNKHEKDNNGKDKGLARCGLWGTVSEIGCALFWVSVLWVLIMGWTLPGASYFKNSSSFSPPSTSSSCRMPTVPYMHHHHHHPGSAGLADYAHGWWQKKQQELVQEQNRKQKECKAGSHQGPPRHHPRPRDIPTRVFPWPRH